MSFAENSQLPDACVLHITLCKTEHLNSPPKLPLKPQSIRNSHLERLCRQVNTLAGVDHDRKSQTNLA